MARFLFLAPLLLSTGCAGSAWRADFDRLQTLSEAVPVSPPVEDGEMDRVLSQPLDLATIVGLARARNPELREAAARTRAGLEEVRRAGSLDDPVLKAETERVPSLAREGETKVGLSQRIPFPGNLSLRSEAATREAEQLHQRYLERERDVIARLKRAYFEYYEAVRSIEAHDDHLKLMQATEKISDAKFRTGAVTQQDVLKPQLEQVLLHAEVLSAEQRKGSAQAAINRILQRAPDAPLGDPKTVAPSDERFDLKELTALAVRSHPDLLAAELRVKSTRASARLAGREATLPDFSVGVDYLQLPGAPDGYGAMLSINLPWFTGRRGAEARGLEQSLRADEAALDAVRARVQFEIRDAWLRTESARRSATLLRSELIPKTAQTVEISRTAYEKDKSSFLDLLDAERLLRDVKLKYIQAVAQYESAVADLEYAVGSDFRRKP